MACWESMEVWVLFFTICLMCATICFNVRKPLRNGGSRDSRRPPNKTRYLKCVEELLKSIDKFSKDCGSMHISRDRCQLLCSECLRLVQPTQPLSILKESFCAIRRAFQLMEDCRSENWLLKAVEFGNCQRHFLEILLDLHGLPIIGSLIGSEVDMATKCRSIDISKKTKSELDDAWKSDKAALSRKLKSVSRRDRWLADQLEPTANPLLIVPDDLGRYVTQFDFLKAPWSHDGGNGISVFPIRFRNKEFVIKARIRKSEAEEQEYTTLRKEATFMKKCRHPYAVALLGYWEFVRTEVLFELTCVPLLLMESMECDLGSIIPRNKRRWLWGGTGGFPALDAINFVLPVAKVMKYLHESGVVHLDLKPKNILYTRVPGTQDLPKDVSVKLADFGEAMDKAGVGKEGKIGKPGTSGYMDPDMWAQKGSIDLVKADVFSFGMVLGEVLTGLSPMEALSCEFPREFYKKLQEGKQVPLPEETPNPVKSIVESCLKLKPDERPSFVDICWELQHARFLLNGCT